MFEEKIKAARDAEKKMQTAEYNLENAIVAIIVEYQQTQEDFCVRFTEKTSLPLFRDEYSNELIEYEFVKIRNGELYIKLSSHVDENWFCPYDYGKLDYDSLLNCLTNLV